MTDQKLGIKVFYYYLSRRVPFGLLLLIVSFICYFSKSFLASLLFFIFPVNMATSIINYIVIALFVISVLYILFEILRSWLDYINCTFTVSEQSFNITRGILNKKEVFIPYRQIQDISIEQSFYNKMMGISKLIILTAGNDNNDKVGESEGIFQVIDSNLAQVLQKDLLERTNVQRIKEIKS